MFLAYSLAVVLTSQTYDKDVHHKPQTIKSKDAELLTVVTKWTTRTL